MPFGVLNALPTYIYLKQTSRLMLNQRTINKIVSTDQNVYIKELERTPDFKKYIYCYIFLRYFW